jgi:hypothetical protein
MSATTRVMMLPTVRHPIRSSLVTAVLEHWVANHPTVSSNPFVWRAPWRAQGTAATVTPCLAHVTRGASASRNTWIVPRSSPRQRRRPSPRSNRGERRPHRPQRRFHRAFGRTCATTTCSASSNSMSSSTVLSHNPSSLRHTLNMRRLRVVVAGPQHPETYAGDGALHRSPPFTPPRERQESQGGSCDTPVGARTTQM